MNKHPTLQTKRLSLRPLTLDALDNLHHLWTAPDVRRYLWDDQVISKERTTEELHKTIDCFATHGFGLWAVCLLDRTHLIGFCGFVPVDSPQEAELLYGLAAAYWQQGLMTEAATAVLQHGFDNLGLERIVASADVPNVASIRVMEKLGMQFDKQETVNGLELVFYSIRRKAFETHASTSAA